MADPIEEEARRLLKAQSEILSQYAAAVENDLATGSTGHGAYMREQLRIRAETARNMAAVMFRAATYEPSAPVANAV